MGLQDYRKKRDFQKSREPSGGLEPPGGGLRFVVQKHAASHLHYDFRLELDGVLKSWAVPKGPTLDPSQKRLAMMVEDHPYEYRNFEGVIPKGNYGAGRVIIWDEGFYHSARHEEKGESESDLREGLRKGDLKFVLHGRKLQGEFALVRMRGDDPATWLLLKKKDEFAAAGVGADETSVRSGREVEEVTEENPREDELQRLLADLPRSGMPHRVKPMLATLVEEPFDDPEWLFEIKLDGYRALAETGREGVSLYSRNNQPFNELFPALLPALGSIGRDAVVDGEIVVYDEGGRSGFQLLQNYRTTGQGRIRYVLFDLLFLDGRDLRTLPLLSRKELLRRVMPQRPELEYMDHLEGEGKDFFRAAVENGLEGIVAKRSGSRYLSGRRSREWLKIKAAMRQEAVICGFTRPRGSRKNFGALVLGVWREGELVYIGHSGGGFDERTLEAIHGQLLTLVQEQSPFRNPPKTNMPVTWVRPELVCEVSFSEWTGEGLMRHPVFLGLREDKDPATVVRELPADRDRSEASPPVPPARREMREGNLRLTNLDKIFWPGEGYTKGDLIEYYRAVSGYILPYLKDRPESLYRTPNGIDRKGFFHKNMGKNHPQWLKTVEIPSDGGEGSINYLLCQDQESLIYMANLGCIEINPWLSRIQHPDRPDYLVIDLDPEEIGFDKVVETALAVREILLRAGAPGFPKTSGVTGIHIYVPLGARYDYDQAVNFAKLLAMMANDLVPDFTSLERSPGKRQKKVYLDFLQNRRGQTLAAPYSLRPKPGAPVSTPLEWSEVKQGLDPRGFTIRTIHERLVRRGDLFSGVLGPGIDMAECIRNLER